MEVSILRLEKEWQITHQSHEEDAWDENTWSIDLSSAPLEAGKTARFVFNETEPKLSVNPLLPDRPMVMKPNTPFTIPNNQNITLFVSTLLWLNIQVHGNDTPLLELPTQRPSDTWFGPSTLEGQLCYASPTHGRLLLEELPYRPYKAITQVTIQNNADSAFLLDRLNLPVPYLSLFQSTDNQLWTQNITMHREKDASTARLQIENTPPSEAGRTTLLREAREQVASGSLISAFSALFG